MQDFHLQQLAKWVGLSVWRVDGQRIRNTLDIEFTNGSHHFESPYIPRDELWIDREAADIWPTAKWPEEWESVALRLVIEREYASKGKTINAIQIEERARQKARQPFEFDALYLDELGHVDTKQTGLVTVHLVHGKAVRDWIWPDFVQGGHWLVYRFVPKGEIWIDDAILPAEWKPVIEHELHEAVLMAEGMGYDEAHAMSSRFERAFRGYKLMVN